ncbi:MAG: hypothetical protein IIB30_08000 [Chloroflexi bacterium]|nr:hypothetical protein [Chloroflexota bacterium]
MHRGNPLGFIDILRRGVCSNFYICHCRTGVTKPRPNYPHRCPFDTPSHPYPSSNTGPGTNTHWDAATYSGSDFYTCTPGDIDV